MIPNASPSIIADLWVCCDCIQAIANGTKADDAEKDAAILAGFQRELPYQWVPEGPHTGDHAPECGHCDGTGKDDQYGDECSRCKGEGRIDEDECADTVDFSTSGCDCCNEWRGGSRHRCALIKVGGA